MYILVVEDESTGLIHPGVDRKMADDGWDLYIPHADGLWALQNLPQYEGYRSMGAKIVRITEDEYEAMLAKLKGVMEQVAKVCESIRAINPLDEISTMSVMEKMQEQIQWSGDAFLKADEDEDGCHLISIEEAKEIKAQREAELAKQESDEDECENDDDEEDRENDCEDGYPDTESCEEDNPDNCMDCECLMVCRRGCLLRAEALGASGYVPDEPPAKHRIEEADDADKFEKGFIHIN
jgi:hypothetical protein